MTLDGSVYDVQIVANDPYIFVPDEDAGAAVVPKVKMVTDVTDDPDTSVEIAQVYHSGTAAQNLGDVGRPRIAPREGLRQLFGPEEYQVHETIIYFGAGI